MVDTTLCVQDILRSRAGTARGTARDTSTAGGVSRRTREGYLLGNIRQIATSGQVIYLALAVAYIGRGACGATTHATTTNATATRQIQSRAVGREYYCAVLIGAIGLDASGTESIQGFLGRMSITISAANRNHAITCACCIQELGRTRARATVVRHLQNVAIQVFAKERFLNTRTNIACKQELIVAICDHADNGGVVGVGSARTVVQDCQSQVAICIGGANAGGLHGQTLGRNSILKVCIRGRGRRPGRRPNLFYSIVIENGSQTAAVVCIGVGVNHQFDVIDTHATEITRNSGALIRLACVNQDITVADLNQDAITLPYIDVVDIEGLTVARGVGGRQFFALGRATGGASLGS